MVRSGRSVPDAADALGVSQQSLRNWVRQAQLDARERDDGLTSAEREQLRLLRRKVRRLEQSVICSNEPRPSSQRRPTPSSWQMTEIGMRAFSAENQPVGAHRVSLALGLLRLRNPSTV